MTKMVTLSLLMFVSITTKTTTNAQQQHIELEKLPYAYTALEPIISSRTLEYHHDKHHAKYVVLTNQLLKTDKLKHLQGLELEKIMETSYINQYIQLYNNAAQSYNHAFYWNCMSPPEIEITDATNNLSIVKDKRKPSKEYHPVLYNLIIQKFNTLEKFYIDFISTANKLFGSGWVWLVYDYSTHTLEIIKTIGADNPIVFNSSYKPLLVIDVWEHSYYLDYQNQRPEYVEKFIYKLINWNFVANNLNNVLPESKKQDGNSNGNEDYGSGSSSRSDGKDGEEL